MIAAAISSMAVLATTRSSLAFLARVAVFYVGLGWGSHPRHLFYIIGLAVISDAVAGTSTAAMDMSLNSWVLLFSLVLIACPAAAAVAQSLMARLSARRLSRIELSSRLEAVRRLCPLTKLEDPHFSEECSICMGEINSVADGGESLRRLPCCHLFHADCIDVWIAAGNPCPMCRKCPLACVAAV